MGGMPRLRAEIASAAMLALAGPAAAQTASHPLFDSTEPLGLRITAPFRELNRSGDDRSEHDAVIEIDDPLAGPVALPVELRVRGVSRLKLCSYPPLRLDFDRDDVAGTSFEGQNRLKLVYPCERQSSYREYVALELLIYRMFNLMTSNSLRVRPASIEFVYSDSRRPESFVENAFLIEDIEEAAARLGLDVVEADQLRLDALDLPHTALLGLFHYLIGNTDYALLRGPDGEPCCHNGAVIGRDGRALLVLPYDFDQSGLIDAEYAMPNATLRLNSVRDRLYRGFCAVNAGVDPVVELFNERRTGLEALVAEAALGDRSRQRSLVYIEEFFEIINDPRRRTSQIMERCRE